MSIDLYTLIDAAAPKPR